jgi:hypothetical protein
MTETMASGRGIKLVGAAGEYFVAAAPAQRIGSFRHKGSRRCGCDKPQTWCETRVGENLARCTAYLLREPHVAFV